MNKRLLFITNEDWYFVSHRLHLAKIAIDNEFDVGLICNVSNDRKIIESMGVKVFDWQLSRGSINPFNELKTIFKLSKLIKNFAPDIIHSVAIKPVIYSAIISKFQVTNSVYALGGLGFIFTSNNKKARILRVIISNALRLLINNKKSIVILQNPENIDLLVSNNIVGKDRIKLIRGAGVDVDYFLPSKNKIGMPLILLPARMLWDKGIGEFVACAKAINEQGKKARFALIGGVDTDNPEAISKQQLQDWHTEDVVEWWGYQDNMLNVYQQADIICFPSSYGEGLPKALLESASCALPIVAFDVPGCREIVIDGVNGLLIEVKNQKKLNNAVEKLLNDKSLCLKFGKAGRALVLENFSQDRIGNQTLQVWNEALN